MSRTASTLAGVALLVACSPAAKPGAALPIVPVLVPSPSSAPTPVADPCADDETLDPLAHAACVLAGARRAARADANLQVTTADTTLGQDALAQIAATLDARPESFLIATLGSTTIVVGRDPVGAMYGAQELAERLDLDGSAALPLAAPVAGAPALSIRAANPFLVLPEPGEPSWWF